MEKKKSGYRKGASRPSEAQLLVGTRGGNSCSGPAPLSRGWELVALPVRAAPRAAPCLRGEQPAGEAASTGAALLSAGQRFTPPVRRLPLAPRSLLQRPAPCGPSLSNEPPPAAPGCRGTQRGAAPSPPAAPPIYPPTPPRPLPSSIPGPPSPVPARLSPAPPGSAAAGPGPGGGSGGGGTRTRGRKGKGGEGGGSLNKKNKKK